MLVANGAPPVMVAAPTATSVPTHNALPSVARNVRLLVPAAVGRTHGLLAASPTRLQNEDPQATVNETVRFLQQASFGPSFVTDPLDPNFPNSVAHVQAVGFPAWIAEQFDTPMAFPGQLYGDANYLDLTFVEANPPADCDAICRRDNYSVYTLQNQFFANALTGPDQLRQRAAFALSQILVVSGADPDINKASWLTAYLQLLDRNAFGNYRQLLYDITVNPAMGRYLDMVNNNKNNPNENYAREILQLFSVGLDQLNSDGTPQLDANGNRIPTYSQETITNFARVFTGWTFDDPIDVGIINYRDPMIVRSQNNHDTNAKQLLNYPGAVGGGALPPGMTAEDELNAALDNIFNHPNVGPFIGKNLIQHLVTSNPSPAYVSRVTDAFNTGSAFGFGSGQRGDLKAVIAAVLLDPEARNMTPDTNFGHLREPVLFIANTLRAFNTTPDTTDFVLGELFLPAELRMDQDLFRSPTVFNYYPPDNKLAGSTLFAPEFAIRSTSTALAHINFIYRITYTGIPPSDPNRPIGTGVDLSPLEPLAADPGGPGQLLDELNTRLLYGTMSADLRTAVLNAITAIPDTDPDYLNKRVSEAVYLVATSSQYQVER